MMKQQTWQKAKACRALWIAIFLLFCASTGYARGSAAVGKIIALRGAATVTLDDGSSRPLSLGAEISVADLIKTGRRGRLQIMFADNTIVSLGPASEFVVKDYRWDEASKKGKMTSQVNEGVFRVLGGSITKSSPESFTTETPSATIGIRGSMYAGKIRSGQLAVVFQGGKGIFVRNPFGTVDISRPGFGTRVAGDAQQPPPEPVQFTPEELGDLDPSSAPPPPPEQAPVGAASAGNEPPVDDGAAAEPPPEEGTAVAGDEQDGQTPPPGDESAAGEAQAPAAEQQASAPDAEQNAPDSEEQAAPVLAGEGDGAPLAGAEAPMVPAAGDTTVDATPLPTNTGDMSLSGDGGMLTGNPLPPSPDGTAAPLQPIVDPVLIPVDNQSTTDTFVDNTLSGSTTQNVTVAAFPSGRFRAVLDDAALPASTTDKVWFGPLSGQTDSGKLSGTAATNFSDILIGPYAVPEYNPGLAYTGTVKQPVPRSMSLLGGTISTVNAELISSNTGEFSILHWDIALGADPANPDHFYRELGFFGTPTLPSNMPATGISGYRGLLAGSLSGLTTGEFEELDGAFEMMVNWHSGKIFGAVLDAKAGAAAGHSMAFFLGEVVAGDDKFVINQFFGNDIIGDGMIDPNAPPPDPNAPPPNPEPILAVSGNSLGNGQFYGNQWQGAGIQLGGSTYDIKTQAAEENWTVIAAGYRDLKTGTPQTGVANNWGGFAVGVAEDMDAPDSNRRVYYSGIDYMDEMPRFSLAIDRDAGTLNGVLNAEDLDNPTLNQLAGLEIGGSNPSVYIDDRIFAAILGGSAPISENSLTGPIKPYGNFLVVEDPARPQLASYASWGSWEIAYTGPDSGSEYHVHMPSSLWVAGEMTPVTAITSLVASNFKATYTGPAYGVNIPDVGQMQELLNGQTNLLIDFAPGAMNPVSGTISFDVPNPAATNGFDPVSLNVAGGYLSSSNKPTFSGYISGMPGQVDGAFFGPNAESVGGSFHADPGGANRYLGVFGGDR